MWFHSSLTNACEVKCHYYCCCIFLRFFFFYVDHFKSLEFVTELLLFYVLVFGPKACGVLAPRPGIKLALPALEGEVLTTGLPGKSLLLLFSREHQGSERLRKLPKVTQSMNGESRFEPGHFESTFEPYPRSQSRKCQIQDISPGRSI